MSTFFKKPFLLSIGPQRAGAQYIHDYFQSRDDVCLPHDVKEVFFFDRHYQRGSHFYAEHFPINDHHRLIAEISTTAFDHPDTPGRVYDLFGDNLTLLCPLRDPIERAMAVYEDYKRYGIVTGSIEEAIAQAPQILFSSRYADHLSRWLDVFEADKIKILYYEQATSDLNAYLKTLCDIAGLDFHPPSTENSLQTAINTIKTKFCPSIENTKITTKDHKETHTWLTQRLKEEKPKLEDLLKTKIPHW